MFLYTNIKEQSLCYYDLQFIYHPNNNVILMKTCESLEGMEKLGKTIKQMICLYTQK